MLPVMLEVGPVRIYAMGVAAVLGAVMGLYWWWKMGRDEHWDEIGLFDAYFAAIAAFVVVGRVGYVWQVPEIMGWWARVALLVHPGLNYLAGWLGATVAIGLSARIKGWPLWRVADSWAVTMSLLLSWGMVGMLLNRGEVILDSWGIAWALLGFGVTSLVRKNFRFYSWYKGEASVAKDGLAALVLFGWVGIYYVGRGLMVGNGWLTGAGGMLVLLALVGIGQRSGKGGELLGAVQWIKKLQGGKKRR